MYWASRWLRSLSTLETEPAIQKVGKFRYRVAADRFECMLHDAGRKHGPVAGDDDGWRARLRQLHMRAFAARNRPIAIMPRQGAFQRPARYGCARIDRGWAKDRPRASRQNDINIVGDIGQCRYHVGGHRPVPCRRSWRTRSVEDLRLQIEESVSVSRFGKVINAFGISCRLHRNEIGRAHV